MKEDLFSQGPQYQAACILGNEVFCSAAALDKAVFNWEQFGLFVDKLLESESKSNYKFLFDLALEEGLLPEGGMPVEILNKCLDQFLDISRDYRSGHRRAQSVLKAMDKTGAFEGIEIDDERKVSLVSFFMTERYISKSIDIAIFKTSGVLESVFSKALESYFETGERELAVILDDLIKNELCEVRQIPDEKITALIQESMSDDPEKAKIARKIIDFLGNHKMALEYRLDNEIFKKLLEGLRSEDAQRALTVLEFVNKYNFLEGKQIDQATWDFLVQVPEEDIPYEKSCVLKKLSRINLLPQEVQLPEGYMTGLIGVLDNNCPESTPGKSVKSTLEWLSSVLKSLHSINLLTKEIIPDLLYENVIYILAYEEDSTIETCLENILLYLAQNDLLDNSRSAFRELIQLVYDLITRNLTDTYDFARNESLRLIKELRAKGLVDEDPEIAEIWQRNLAAVTSEENCDIHCIEYSLSEIHKEDPLRREYIPDSLFENLVKQIENKDTTTSLASWKILKLLHDNDLMDVIDGARACAQALLEHYNSEKNIHYYKWFPEAIEWFFVNGYLEAQTMPAKVVASLLRYYIEHGLEWALDLLDMATDEVFAMDENLQADLAQAYSQMLESPNEARVQDAHEGLLKLYEHSWVEKDAIMSLSQDLKGFVAREVLDEFVQADEFSQQERLLEEVVAIAQKEAFDGYELNEPLKSNFIIKLNGLMSHDGLRDKVYAIFSVLRTSDLIGESTFVSATEKYSMLSLAQTPQ
jgi:hypothetical protein